MKRRTVKKTFFIAGLVFILAFLVAVILNPIIILILQPLLILGIISNGIGMIMHSKDIRNQKKALSILLMILAYLLFVGCAFMIFGMSFKFGLISTK